MPPTKRFTNLKTDCFHHVADGSSLVVLEGLFYYKDKAFSGRIGKDSVYPVGRYVLAPVVWGSNLSCVEDVAFRILLFQVAVEAGLDR